MQCILRRGNKEIAHQVTVADTFFSRLRGLMGRRDLPVGEGLLLAPCPQVHTCFMRFSIDVVFCNKQGKVLYVKERMKPWRLGKFVCGGYYTLELPGGTLAGQVQAGDELIFLDQDNNLMCGENK